MSETDGRTTIDRILARRSIRSLYTTSPVSKHDLKLIAECGLAAPSSKNAKPWCLHVVSDAATLEWISDAVRGADEAHSYVPHDPRTGQPHPTYVSTVAESALILRDVAAAVFVENRGVFSGGREQLARATPEALRGSLTGYGLELIGLGAAIENMWLAANELGLAAAFMGDVVVAESAIQQRLDITGDLVGALVLGHSSLGATARRQLSSEGLVTWH